MLRLVLVHALILLLVLVVVLVFLLIDFGFEIDSSRASILGHF